MLTESFGNSALMPIDAIFIAAGGRGLSTAGDTPDFRLARRWLDVEEIRADLAASESDQIVVRLRARFGADGTATGTLSLDGRTHRVRCEMGRIDR